jgi:hypothetical protein
VFYGVLFILDAVTVLLTLVIIVVASTVSHRRRWASPPTPERSNLGSSSLDTSQRERA